jgi:hypothetical protein
MLQPSSSDEEREEEIDGKRGQREVVDVFLTIG